MPRLPEFSPELVGDSPVERVVWLAEEAQLYLNQYAGQITEEDLQAIKDILNAEAAPVYAGLEAFASGIFKVYRPVEGEIGASSVDFEAGLVGGKSDGFVIELTDYFADEGVEYSHEEDELYDRIKDYAMGPYLVCHAILIDSKEVISRPFGRFINTKNFAVAPVCSTEFAVPEARDREIYELDKEENTKKVAELDGGTRATIEEVITRLSASDNVLTTLKEVTPILEATFRLSDQETCITITTYIQNFFSSLDVNKNFRVNGVDVFISTDDPDSDDLEIGGIDGEVDIQILGIMPFDSIIKADDGIDFDGTRMSLYVYVTPDLEIDGKKRNISVPLRDLTL